MNNNFEDFRQLIYKELAVIIKEEDTFIVISINTLDTKVLDILAIVIRLKLKRGIDSIYKVL